MKFEKTFISIATNIVLTLIIIFYFFSPILSNPNRIMFSTHGDGIRAYYVAMYHAKHDKEWFNTQSLNYPYGENVFFTDSQPLMANFIKFLKPLIDLTDYIIGITNLLMLIGFLISSLFICLIFLKLKLPSIVSVIAGIAITFLSPQLNRLGGHYSLAYVCTIPIIIYLLIRYHEKPSYQKSLFIILVGTIFTGTHFYQYVFFAILVLFYHLNQWIFSGINKSDRNFKLINGSIQLFIPFLIFMVLLHFTDYVTDRLSYPKGFFEARAFPKSVFFPVYKPYLLFFTENISFDNVKWEGRQYSGLMTTIFFFLLLILFIIQLFKKNFKNLYTINENPSVNFLLWAGLFSLLYSWGIPFILGLESLVDKIGIVRQVRAIGRFVWVFYFCFNILLVYILFLKYKNGNKLIWASLLFVCMLIMSMEAFSNIKVHSKHLDNHFELITDYENLLPENKLLRNIDTSLYQAIIPLPYFNVGSEHIQSFTKSKIKNYSFWLSLKTGIPNIGMFAARSSISQALYQSQLFKHSSKIPEILELHKKNKDYLLIVDTLYKQNEISEKMINASIRIGNVESYRISSLNYASLISIYKHKTETLKQEIDLKLQNKNISKNSNYLVYKDNQEVFKLTGQKYKDIFDDTLSLENPDTIIISFWMDKVDIENVSKTRVVLYLRSLNNKDLLFRDDYFRNHIVAYDENKALYEFHISGVEYHEKYKFLARLYNKKFHKNFTINIDHLLIRDGRTTVYEETDQYLRINNRMFYKPEN